MLWLVFQKTHARFCVCISWKQASGYQKGFVWMRDSPIGCYRGIVMYASSVLFIVMIIEVFLFFHYVYKQCRVPFQWVSEKCVSC